MKLTKIREGGMNRWATHMPFLSLALSWTRGSVLELGIGALSTPFLIRATKLCEEEDRKFVGLESRKEWIQRLFPLANLYKHVTLALVNNWDDGVEKMAKEKWGLIFVDHEPLEHRERAVEVLAKSTDIMVVHDIGMEKGLFKKALSFFKYHLILAAEHPYTGMFSNKIDLRKKMATDFCVWKDS